MAALLDEMALRDTNWTPATISRLGANNEEAASPSNQHISGRGMIISLVGLAPEPPLWPWSLFGLIFPANPHTQQPTDG